MTLNEARELRQELETIEATMKRIQALWLSEDFPTLDTLEGLAKEVGGIQQGMGEIIRQTGELPSADDDLDDLGKAVWSIEKGMTSIIEKAEELPTADELR